VTFYPESPVNPKKIDEFYHYFATGRFGKADVSVGAFRLPTVLRPSQT
jgi:hypothetical protein